MFGTGYFTQKQGAPYTKIFRPWDTSKNCQDATISTTTEEEQSNAQPTPEEPVKAKCCEPESKKSPTTPRKGFKRVSRKREEEPQSPSNPLPEMMYPDPAVLAGVPMYPEILHANLAHGLGLAPTDPLLLESLAHGCALEDYARVLSQEHQNKMLNARKQRPKKYKCPHCDVGFSNNGQLKGHIRIHTGERPFKCDEKDCGKTFTRNEELTRHKRIHSGLRPFPCSHCGKRFGRKDHLKKHSRTHFQPRGMYAVPVMLPFDTWTTAAATYPYVPMFGY